MTVRVQCCGDDVGFEESAGGDYILRRSVYSLPNVIKEEGIGVAWSTSTTTGKYNTEFRWKTSKEAITR
jgi:hypothetical protein